MSNIDIWKTKFRAGAIHLGISLCVVLLAAILVFGLWYPYPYSDISGGKALFMLVSVVDVTIGPLITFIVYSKRKPLREMRMDFAIVGILQGIALAYGLWTVYVARPVYLVYEYDRMHVIHAVDIEPASLSKAPALLQKLPITGPKLIALRTFTDPTEQFDATMNALASVPLSTRTDLWQPYASQTESVLKNAKSATELSERFPGRVALINDAITGTGRSATQLKYLPMVDRENVWTILIDSLDATPVGYFPLDSF